MWAYKHWAVNEEDTTGFHAGNQRHAWKESSVLWEWNESSQRKRGTMRSFVLWKCHNYEGICLKSENHFRQKWKPSQFKHFFLQLWDVTCSNLLWTLGNIVWLFQHLLALCIHIFTSALRCLTGALLERSHCHLLTLWSIGWKTTSLLCSESHRKCLYE